MKLKLEINDKSEIIQYAELGGLDNSVECEIDSLPDDFYNNFEPRFYLFKNGEIIKNPDYVEPSDTPPVSSPTSVQEAINKLGEVTAKIADDDNQIKSALNKLGLAVADLQQTKEVK